MKKNKTYSKFTKENKDIVYTVNELARITYIYNSITYTYLGCEFRFFDNRFNAFIKNSEMFGLIAGGSDIEKVLADFGYMEVEVTDIEALYLTLVK